MSERARMDASLKNEAIRMSPYADQVSITDIHVDSKKRNSAHDPTIDKISAIVERVGLPIPIGVQVIHGTRFRFELIYGTDIFLSWERNFLSAQHQTEGSLRQRNSEIERWATIPCLVHSHETTKQQATDREKALFDLLSIKSDLPTSVNPVKRNLDQNKALRHQRRLSNLYKEVFEHMFSDYPPMLPEELEERAKEIWGYAWNPSCARLFDIRDMNNYIRTKTGKTHGHVGKDGRLPVLYAAVLRELPAKKLIKLSIADEDTSGD